MNFNNFEYSVKLISMTVLHVTDQTPLRSLTSMNTSYSETI